MTPVFTCGWECGVLGSVGEHWGAGTGISISTTTVRTNGSSLRVNPSAAAASSFIAYIIITTGTSVFRFYIRFTTLPNADTNLAYIPSGNQPGLVFKQSDSKIYCGQGSTPALGATGVSVTTGVWYRIDLKINQNSGSGTGTIDAQVDGAACGQKTWTVTASATTFRLGGSQTCSGDWFYDDLVISNTSGDYPIGDGYVDTYVPTADGTHNVAGTNDFERGNTGTDIDNTTTTSFQLVDDVPLPSGTVDEADNIRCVLPANPTTDYVECVFGPAPGVSTPTAGPRFVEVILAHHEIATQTGEMEVRLNDNGSFADIYNPGSIAGVTTYRYARAGFADPPSAATVWHANNDGSNGDFRDLRFRVLGIDSAPDQCLDGIMIEAEFAPGNTTTPQTITAKSRVTATTTKTQTAKSRLQVTTQKTLNAVSRIRKSVQATLTAISRLTATTARTQPAQSRITVTTTRTQPAVSRVQKVVQATITAISKIVVAINQTITATTRIQKNVERTITSLSRLQKVVQQTIQSRSRMLATVAQTQPARSRIQKSVGQTVTAKSAVQNTTVQTITALSRLQITVTVTLPARSRILVSAARTVTAVSRILRSVSQTIVARTRVTATTLQTILSRSRMTATTVRTIPARSRLTATTQQTQAAISRITVTTQQTVTAKSRVMVTVQKTLTALSRVTATTLRTITAVSSIIVGGVTTKTIAAVSRILVSVLSTVTAVSRIQKSVLQTIEARSRITASVGQTQPARSRITVATQQTQTSISRVQQLTVQTITCVSRIAADVNYPLSFEVVGGHRSGVDILEHQTGILVFNSRTGIEVEG